MKNTITLFLILIFQSIFSQKILPQYPEGQSAYKGGSNQMFAEMQDYFLKSGVKPCAKDEIYLVTLKIDETGKPFLIKKKSDDVNIEKNKCAFDLVVKSLGTLKNWQSAEENGKRVTAYLDFPFLPNDFFENYKSDYDISNVYQSPELPGGMGAFRKEIYKNLTAYLDFDSYKPKGKFIVFFEVNTDGKISNIDIEPKIANSDQFFDDIKFVIKKVKGKFTPAKLKGVPIKSKFRLPLNFDLQD